MGIVRPAAQAFKQLPRLVVQCVGAHVIALIPLRNGLRHQPHPQSLTRQQQSQRVAHNTATENAHIEFFCHKTDCKTPSPATSVTRSRTGNGDGVQRHSFVRAKSTFESPLANRLGDSMTLNDSPTTPDLQATIARLFVYPIKSCAGVELREALITETGFDLDRAWMVVDEQGVFVTQRESPRMALIRPQIKTDEVVLRAPGMLALHLKIDTVEHVTRVEVWDDTVNAFDMGPLAAQWFSDFLSPAPPGQIRLSQPYRLVRFDPEQRRLSKLAWTAGVEAPNQFSDGFPLLVISTASLEGLNKRLLAAGRQAVGIERFRPNIVLSGMDEHDEDRAGDLHITTDEGAVQLRPVKPCPRCPIPNIDPLTALCSADVGDTLQAYRQNPHLGGAVTFGVNAIVVDGVDRLLRLGQRVSASLRFG